MKSDTDFADIDLSDIIREIEEGMQSSGYDSSIFRKRTSSDGKVTIRTRRDVPIRLLIGAIVSKNQPCTFASVSNVACDVLMRHDTKSVLVSMIQDGVLYFDSKGQIWTSKGYAEQNSKIAS